MELSALLIRIVFLLLPGGLGSCIYRKLRGRSKKKPWEDLIEILIFSAASYLVVSALLQIDIIFHFLKPGPQAASQPRNLQSFAAFFDEKSTINWREVLAASVGAALLAVVAAFLHTHRWINRAAARANISKRTGDEDIWDFFHNSPELTTRRAVYVRDHARKVVYYGYIRAYSESEKEREILLVDVDVYTDEEFQPLYKMEAVYCCRDKYRLTLEVPWVAPALPTAAARIELGTAREGT